MIIDASNMPQTVNHVFYFILAISVALLLVITFLMIFFVIKYNRKKNRKSENIEGNIALEITWTVIPTLLVLGMFYYGWAGYKIMKDVPDDAMVINVTGRMWSWLFEYDNGIQSDTLYVPIDKPVRLNLKSQDVLHSFYIPAFRVKHDVVPGLENSYLWFHPRTPGSFDVFCAEYCGQQHSYMLTKLVVMPENEFQRWKTSSDTSAQSVTPPAPANMTSKTKVTEQGLPRGLMLLVEKGCTACHTTDGTPMVATSFKGLFGRKQLVITDGKERRITVDEAYFKKSILEPNADLVKGYDPIMPEVKEGIGDDEIQAMISYIKEIK